MKGQLLKMETALLSDKRALKEAVSKVDADEV